MKHKTCYSTGIAAIVLVLPAAADVSYSGLLDTPIPADFTGVTVAVAGGTLNPFFGGVGVANDDVLQPFRSGTGNLDNLLNFAAGATLDAGTLSLSTGYGGSLAHLGSAFTAGAEGYLGFKLNGSNYGWMRVVFTNNTGGALIKDWAYDNGGGAIATGNVQQSAVSGTAQTVTLSSASGSFALGTPLTDGLGNTGGVVNSVVKTGANTATLTNTNLYTGATTVSAGTLAVAAAGSINTSSGVTVTAGAKFLHNSSTALTVPPSLSGAGVSNRAVLGGSGQINTSVTLDNPGDTLAPGNSPGVQAFTPAQTWSSFSYDWEINNFTGTTPGTDFDQLAIGATLDLTGALGAYHLNMLSLTAGNVAGEVPNFSEIDRSWTVLTTAAGIAGFDPANWTVHVDGFTNPATGGFALAQNGNDLVLSYTSVPEPSVAALLGTCGALALLRRRRAQC
jgi:autotransporter-associated beta strand protein